MHIIKIVVTGVGETVVARYKSEDTARQVYIALQAFKITGSQGNVSVPFDIIDDYGMTVSLAPYSVALVVMFDLEKSAVGDAASEFERQTAGNKEIERLRAATAGGLIRPDPGLVGAINGGRRQ